LSHNLLIGLSLIIVLGILAQWISWRFRLPSILLLLIFGFLAGPITNLLDPDAYFGDLLFPIVSISVAVILFEGGLSLKISELKTVGSVVRNLISIGLLITWGLSSLFAVFIMGMDIQIAILLGAILVVTGPTVILPILRHVKPTGQINSVLKWEGIINDPIGAMLAILVFEVIIAAGFAEATTQVITGLLKTILISTTIGFAGGYLIVILLKYNLIPDFLQNSISLAIVVAVFSASQLIQTESGLLAVTVMGIFLTNQKKVIVKHIIEFKENLRVLLISILFILLAARLKISDLEFLDLNSLVYVGILILVVRPVAVFLSSIRSSLNFKEKIYLSAMAPRGIVAAAVTSIFAIRLGEAGIEDVEALVPLMFLIIVATIAIYGLLSMPLAKLFKIANPHPQGCIILGAYAFSVDFGKALKEAGYKVLMVDTNYSNISYAKSQGLQGYYGSIISENITTEIDLNGIGKLLALTPNQEINSLAALYFSKAFEGEVYQLSVEEEEDKQGENVSKELRGKILFGTGYTFSNFKNLFNKGYKINKTKFTAEYNYADFKKRFGNYKKFIPLFLNSSDKKLYFYTADEKPEPEKNDTLFYLSNEKL
jgi:NhaP-type Na+/H+ or K+/H+ antiporter